MYLFTSIFLLSDDKTVTRIWLLNTAGEFDVESIRYLDMRQSSITNISAMKECTNLVRLNLSYNKLSNITALKNLMQLEALNLASNFITSLGEAFLDKLTFNFNP